jgi:hypothetical protein
MTPEEHREHLFNRLAALTRGDHVHIKSETLKCAKDEACILRKTAKYFGLAIKRGQITITSERVERARLEP